jgi:hypothetical protein
MIGPFIEAMLGDVGRAILYFYRDHALVINIIVLTYGLFMYAAWMNLLRIYRFLIVEIAKAAHTSEDLNRKKSNKKIRKVIGVPWEKAVETSPYPFIARLGALIPKRKTVGNLQQLLNEKDLADKALQALQGAPIKRMMPNIRQMLQQERGELAAKEQDRSK